MLISLTKEDVINMIIGTNPGWNMSAMDHHLVRKCGTYCGGFVDRWDWNRHELNKLSDQELLTVYFTCKKDK